LPLLLKYYNFIIYARDNLHAKQESAKGVLSMSNLSFETTLNLPFDSAIEKTTEGLKTEGFGVLTRIDFDQKIKEKLGHTLPKTAILGACNPGFAFEAYSKNPDMLLLVPCNVVVEDLGGNQTRIRLIKPSTMVKALESAELVKMAEQIDGVLKRVSQSLAAGEAK
jgi:uncharacterized protein (DUF302 family)